MHDSYNLSSCFPQDAMINRFLIPLAVPLLLFDSDLNRVINDTGTLLAAFGVGAIATIVGTLVAFPLIPLTSLGPDVGWRVACALAARHIGGAINFVAVAETLHIGGSAVSAASKCSLEGYGDPIALMPKRDPIAPILKRQILTVSQIGL